MLPARSYATAVARAIAPGVTAPWIPLMRDPSDLRSLALALSDGRDRVDFEALVEASWQLGVPVLHLPEIPVGGKKPDGMVTFVAGRPVVILLKAVKLAEWMVFILAHELGHIAMGHLGTLDGAAVVDEKVSLAEEGTPASGPTDGGDTEEVEANAYASGVLVPGGEQITLGNPPWPVAGRLADLALNFGQMNKVSPGHAVLNAANHSPRDGHPPFALGIKAAQVLAERLGTSSTAETCRAAAQRHLNLDKLRPDTIEFLEKLEAI